MARLGPLIAVAALAAGCDSRRIGPEDLDREVVNGAAVLVRDVDLLFVIDTSPSMLEEQLALVDAFPALIEPLAELNGGLPDLHIGVAATDLGAGPFRIGPCEPGGLGGVLQNAPRSGTCPTPTDNYIVDRLDPDGEGRVRNYPETATLAEVFACIAPLGVEGCGFEQPLEAMKLALEGNPGFLRPGANLAIVLLTDEDDCSASEGGLLFDFEDPSLGPVTSWRCFEQGVRCDPDLPRQPGAKQDCAPRESSAYLHPVARYRDFLRGLKPQSRQVLLAAVVAPPEPVAVSVDAEGDPALEPSCLTIDSDNGAPAVRIHALVDELGGDAFSICNRDQDQADDQLTAAGRAIATSMVSSLDGVCLDGYLYDSEPDREGIQPDCEVIDGLELADVPRCEGGTARPCYEIEPLAECAGRGDGLALWVRRTTAAEGAARASCLIRASDEPTMSFYDCRIAPGRDGGRAPLLALLVALAVTAARSRRPTARTGCRCDRPAPTGSARRRARPRARSDR